MKQLSQSLGRTFGASKPDLSAGARQHRNDMAKARRLAAKHPAIQIERDPPNAWWVTVPSIQGPFDPCAGTHFCVGGLELLQAVETYAAWLATPAGALAVSPVQPAPGQATVMRAKLAPIHMTTGGEKTHPMVILDGTVRHWVGIGWVDEGAPSADQASTLPLVVG